MRTLFVVVLLGFLHASVFSQRTCSSFQYFENELSNNPGLQARIDFLEEKIKRENSRLSLRPQGNEPIIIIPVVVHILYNQTLENISEERVYSQLKVLNETYRRLNADTINTPKIFSGLAADCRIEFRLATSDPKRRATSGIVRKYTPVKIWSADDKMKYSAEAGDDAWDATQYLNIWICNMGRVAGYSSFPGGPADKDGIVLSTNVVGINTTTGYEMGKTAVHEVGHWLGLRHIWGDAFCGDDGVDDTPKQNTFTPGCPTGVRKSCSTNSGGDMYMNYMDLTLDACTNLFTEGQKQKMRASFENGGGRASLLKSSGLKPPLFSELILDAGFPKWSQPQLFPNPAFNDLTLDLSYDIRWIGKTIRISNLNGQVVVRQTITSNVMTIDINSLRPGLYFLDGKKEDGACIRHKFMKL